MNFGEKSQSEGTKQLWYGIFTANVIAINPTRKDISKIFGSEYDEKKDEFKYEGTNDDREDFVNISFLLQAQTPEKQIFWRTFQFLKKEVWSNPKEGSGKIKRQEWVNQVGDSQWVDDKKNLWDNFTNFQDENKTNIADKAFRPAIKGEASFYKFIQCWLNKGIYDFGKTPIETDIFIDKDKMFRNVEKYVSTELRPRINDSENSGAFVVAETIKIKDKDGEISYSQNSYGNLVWPLYFLKGSKNKKGIQHSIDSNNWSFDEKEKSESNIKKVKNDFDGLTKNIINTSWLKKFDPETSELPLNATNETFRTDSSDVSDLDY